jgi:hypothetical protein
MNLITPETISIPIRSGVVAPHRARDLARAIATIDPEGVLPVVVVGAGATDAALPARAVHAALPEVACAVGTAGSRIGVAVDCVVAGQPLADARSLESARVLALERAVMAGAAAPTVRISGVDHAPLAYLPGDFVHVTVKATGDIA